ncbi:MAG: hypothetical protein OHK0032_12880 [Thermodesulfovibrionales bacterium]
MVKESQDLKSLVDGAIEDHQKLRQIISFLYDVDIERRFIATKVLGEIARIKPELIKKRWNRIFYAFDDTMSCWGVAEGLGEIGRNMPELRSKIVSLLRRFKRDECSCQGFIWSVCRIGQVERQRIKDLIPDLTDFLNSENACMVGQSIWALGELGITEAIDKIKGFLNDDRETWVYDNDSVGIRRISEIAAEAVKKLSQ